MKTFKEWLGNVRRWISSQGMRKGNGEQFKFNALGCGIALFALWLSLMQVGDLSLTQIILGWFLVGSSGVLFLIFLIPKRLWERWESRASRHILPVIPVVAVGGLILGLLQALGNLRTKPDVSIAIWLGFLWVSGCAVVMISQIGKPKWRYGAFGTVTVMMVVYGVAYWRFVQLAYGFGLVGTDIWYCLAEAIRK